MDDAVNRPGAEGSPQIAKVDAGRPVVWLERGWSDFKRSAVPSLIYGAWVAAFGFALLLVAWRFTYLVPARYMNVSLQTVFLAGDIWAVLLPNMLFMLAVGTLFFWLTWRKLHKRVA